MSSWDEVEDPTTPSSRCRCPTAAAWGLQLPGLVELPEGNPSEDRPTKNGPGRDGATATWQGYELREIKLTLRMWRARHRLEWRRILPQIMPRRASLPRRPSRSITSRWTTAASAT